MIISMVLLSLSSTLLAQTIVPDGSIIEIEPLDKIVFQLSTKEWVSTKSALLTVNINATLTNADIVKVRSTILTALNKIASGNTWHLIQFDRSQDNSGLEKLIIVAQNQVPQERLTDVYQRAKDVSHPGETYTIDGIDFKPGLFEIQAVKAQLRARLYQEANDEIIRLNKIYPNQRYSLHRLFILDNLNDTPKAYSTNQIHGFTMAALPNPTSTPSLTLSNQLVMSALIEVASNRPEGEAGEHK
jgi:hypothetical protein